MKRSDPIAAGGCIPPGGKQESKYVPSSRFSSLGIIIFIFGMSSVLNEIFWVHSVGGESLDRPLAVIVDANLAGDRKIELKNGFVTIDVKNLSITTFQQIFTTATRIALMVDESIQGTVSYSGNDEKPDKAIVRIFSDLGQCNFVISEDGGKISEIRVLGRKSTPDVYGGVGSKEQTKREKLLGLGSKPDQVRIIEIPDGLDYGPESFYVCPDGKVLVCDTQNSRVLEFDEYFETHKIIPTPGVFLSDIVWVAGNIVVLDVPGAKIIQIDSKGNIIKKEFIPEIRYDSWEGMFPTQDEVYIRNSSNLFIRLGYFENGLFLRDQIFPEGGKKEMIGERKERVGIVKTNEGNRVFWMLDITDISGRHKKRLFTLPGNVEAILFAKIDKGGSVYFLSSFTSSNGSDRNGIVKVEDSGNIRIYHEKFVENQLWASKRFSVGDNGKVVQMAPIKDGCYLIELQ